MLEIDHQLGRERRGGPCVEDVGLRCEFVVTTLRAFVNGGPVLGGVNGQVLLVGENRRVTFFTIP